MIEDKKEISEFETEVKLDLESLFKEKSRKVTDRGLLEIRISYVILFVWIPIGLILCVKQIINIMNTDNPNNIAAYILLLILTIAATIFGIIFNIKRIRRLS
ncbi:MAG: hypothetical protein KKE16_07060 [Firmicutes bacterium]|nr:hypothetical protein [Bacillota bacterium]